MNTNEVAIRCGEHAFTRLQKLLPQQDRLLPKIYQTTDDQYVIYWDNIYWYETYNSNEAEIVKAFGQAFDYLEKRPFDQNGDLLPGYEFEFLKFETDSGDYQYRSYDILTSYVEQYGIYDFGGLTEILYEVIKEVEEIDLLLCTDSGGKTYLIYTPSYPWTPKTEKEKELTEEKLENMFRKYLRIVTDEQLPVDYKSVENFS